MDQRKSTNEEQHEAGNTRLVSSTVGACPRLPMLKSPNVSQTMSQHTRSAYLQYNLCIVAAYESSASMTPEDFELTCQATQ